MNKLLWCALALLAVPTVSAQTDLDFPQTYMARVAVGDIPTTEATEPAGQVNVVEYLRFDHPMLDNRTIIQFGAGYSLIDCSCGGMSVFDDYVEIPSSTPAGAYVFWVVRAAPATDAFTVPLGMFGAGIANNAQINIYAPTGSEVSAPVSGTQLAGTNGAPFTIYSFTGTAAAPLPGTFWAQVHPTLATETVVPEGPSIGYVEFIVGLALGIIVWYLLVQKGMVQARTRKQVTATAAHKEVAQAEGKDILTARKRILMAGLKELEVAKMKKEVDDATYDKLKSELKKEAVTAMRALEES